MFILTKFIVKILLSFAVVIMLSASVKAQTPVLDLPELQEWYSISCSCSRISYLPNFSSDGGMNAIAVFAPNSPTWFNRYPFDTVNQFSWNGGSWSVVQADFNGDGIPDYLDGEGRIYQGIEKGKLPGVGFGRYERGGDNPFVADFNNDGFDDVLSPSRETKSFRIIFGGKDLTKLRSTQFNSVTSQSYNKGLVAYLNENKQPRILFYSSDEHSEGYNLYEISFIETQSGDSIKVDIKFLDSIFGVKQTKTQQIFEPSLYGFYQSKKSKTYSLIIHTAGLNNNNLGESRGYTIDYDRFNYVATGVFGTFPKGCLTGSIDGDSIEDFAGPVWVKKDGEYHDAIFINSGNPVTNREACCFFFKPTRDDSEDVKYIGDVTGDGIGDIAWVCRGYFSIYKGIDKKMLAVHNNAVIDFTLHQTEPNPIGADGKAVLPATLAHSGNYTLEVL